MNNKKYLVGLIGLIVGFTISFVFTQRYNKQNAVASPVAQSQQAAAPNSQAGMAEVQQLIASARSNPQDFEAQVKAASAFDQIGQTEGTIEFLERAYAADAIKFARLNGAAGFLAHLYQERKKYDDAEKWYKRVIESEPRDTEAMGHLVEVYALKRDARSAEDTLNRLKQTDSSNQNISRLEGMIADVKAGKPVTPPVHQ